MIFLACIRKAIIQRYLAYHRMCNISLFYNMPFSSEIENFEFRHGWKVRPVPFLGFLEQRECREVTSFFKTLGWQHFEYHVMSDCSLYENMRFPRWIAILISSMHFLPTGTRIKRARRVLQKRALQIWRFCIYNKPLWIGCYICTQAKGRVSRSSISLCRFNVVLVDYEIH